jgi:hypothetical protein
MDDPQGASVEPPVHHRRFVIVAASDPDHIIAVLDEFEWASAIMAYAERLRRGTDGRHVVLREARPSELGSDAHAGNLAPPPGMSAPRSRPFQSLDARVGLARLDGHCSGNCLGVQ